MTTPDSKRNFLGGFPAWRVAFFVLLGAVVLAIFIPQIFKAKADNPTNPPAATASPGATSSPSGKPGSKAYVPGNGNLQGAIDQFSKTHDALAFCKAMADVIGGPVEKWWGTQNPDGSSVPNSCVLREADDSDGVPGWPVNLPAGTNSHIWLYDCNLPNNCHATVTATGQGTVQGQMLASRMTVYFVDGAYSASHRGMWTFGQLSGSDRDSACGWVQIGTTVNICSNPGGTTSAGNSNSPGGTTSCTAQSVSSKVGGDASNWKPIAGSPNGFVYSGPSITIKNPGGFIIQTPKHPGDPGLPVGSSEEVRAASAYCASS